MTEFAHTGTELPDPAHYFPPSRGSYNVGPGLYAFGTDLGNGAADRRVFQIDRNFALYRKTKRESRSERLDKYYRIHKYAVDQGETVARFVVRHLVLDYPAWFWLEEHDGITIVHCRLTGEHLHFDAHMGLIAVDSDEDVPDPPYVSALDALASQVQEDFAVISRDRQEGEWTCALHVCFPNHWSVEQKIGQSFAAVHESVAGMGHVTKRGEAVVAAMIDKGPYVRFGWGLASDARLNHHPAPPPGMPANSWRGRRFDPEQAQLFLRVERQVLWGFPAVSAALFGIRTYLTDLAEVDPKARAQLARAVQSMTPAQLHYKGLNRDRILAYLNH